MAYLLDSYVGLLIRNQLISISVEDVYWKIILSGSVTTVPFSKFSLAFSSRIFPSKRVCRSPSSGPSRFVSFFDKLLTAIELSRSINSSVLNWASSNALCLESLRRPLVHQHQLPKRFPPIAPKYFASKASFQRRTCQVNNLQVACPKLQLILHVYLPCYQRGTVRGSPAAVNIVILSPVKADLFTYLL